MKKFLKNLLIFLILPVIIVISVVFVYVKSDVYMDFYNYKNYSWKYSFQQIGDLSTKKLLKSKIKYDSFIFGSSRSVSVYACYLQKKLFGSKFYHYASWSETIGGIYEKMNLVDSLGYKLNNIYIYIDLDNTFQGLGKPLYNEHFLITKENRIDYLYGHFKSFLNSNDKFKIIFNSKMDYVSYPNWNSDLVTNDPRHICSDSILNNYGVKISDKSFTDRIDTLRKKGILPERKYSGKSKEKQISNFEENILVKIKELLVKHKSRYFIVITPLYNQVKFDNSDLEILKGLFGNNLYDFSGPNKYTNDIYNYTDGAHFQYYISKEIIDSIVYMNK